MKILMTADAVGGVLTYAIELSRALSRRGCRIALATMGRSLDPSQRAAFDSIPGIEIHESRYRLEWMRDPWSDVGRAGEWLLGLERRFVPDIIHLNGYAHAALPWRAPALVVAHSCVLSWWKAVRGMPAPPEWDRYRRHVARGLRAADLVVAPTRAMGDAVAAIYDMSRPVRVIPNGRDPGLFMGGEKSDLVLCAAGRLWDEAKNVAALDRAAAGIPWPVYLAGADSHPEGGAAHFAHSKMLGLLDGPALSTWFARAAVYVLPARYEPFGYSALEAALSGCALVLGNIPSLRETWRGAAVFVSPDDPDAIREAILDLIRNPDCRRDLGKQARERAARFTPWRMADGYMAAYREIMEPARETLGARES